MSTVDQKRIAINTLLLYFRMGILMLIGFYTSRVVLHELGEEDFGIYNAVGGIIALMSFLGLTLTTACQRFFSIEIGKNDMAELRRVFSQCLVVFVMIIAAIVLLSETLGIHFLNEKVADDPAKYAGRAQATFLVFQFSVIAVIFQTIRIPHMGMIVAKENMKVFSYISIFEGVGQLAIAFVLKAAGSSTDLLILYAALMIGIQILTSLFYWIYCRLFYPECRLTLSFDWKKLGGVFRFTGWEMIGNFAGVCKSQGINVLIYGVYGPVMNAPRGLSQKIYQAIVQLQSNFFMAAKPQIIKSYAAGEIREMEKLLYQSTRLTFYLLLVVALPIMLETPFILNLWLEEVPDHTVIFTRLILINALIDTFSAPLASAIQATGKNKWYQICMGSTLLAILPVSWVGVKLLGWPVESIMVVSIVFSFLAQIVRTLFVRRQLDFDMKEFIKGVVGMVILISLISFAVPIALQFAMGYDRTVWQSLMVIAFSMLWCSAMVFVIGISRTERKHIIEFVTKIKDKYICRQ